MPSTSLDTADVIGPAEPLQFLGDWLASDHDQLGTSLATSSAARHTASRCSAPASHVGVTARRNE